MKKLVAVIIYMISILLPVYADSGEIKVMYGQIELKGDVPPQIINGRTVLPLRTLFEGMGYSVDWAALEKRATCYRGQEKITVTLDETRILVQEGEEQFEVTADIPCQIISGRIFVPVRAVADACKTPVNWVKETRTVVISEKPEPHFDPMKSDIGAGNICNGGLVSKQGEWVYFRNWVVDWKMYKMHLDGTGLTKLNDDDSGDINVSDRWVYYRNWSDNYRLYKIRTDGTERTKLSDDECQDITVVGSWVYYKNMTDGGKLYKIGTDGMARTRLNNDSSQTVSVSGNVAYYANASDEITLYKINTDGTGRTRLNDDISHYINILGDWVYYINGTDSMIYKIRTDGTGRTRLNDDDSNSLNVLGDWIYYCNVSENSKLYKIRIDGTGRVCVSNDPCLFINVIGEWVYYLNKSEGVLYKVRTDGRSRQMVTKL